VGSAQTLAAKQKDRLQARCLAVAIFPELLHLEVRHERTTKIIDQEFPKAKAKAKAKANGMTAIIVSTILDTRIDLPPILSGTIDK
jgi:hypothetical protein